VRKKLLVLDLALAVVVAILAAQVRDKWTEARKRSQVMFGQTLKQLPPPPYSALAPVKPVIAAAYSDVALKYLFSPDRNPTVVVEPPKEKPMPDLPIYYGFMNLNEGATAIMSVKPGAPGRGIRFGEKVGEFTLVSVDDDVVTLEWNGKTVTKTASELRSKRGEAAHIEAPARSESTAQTPAQPAGSGEAAPGGDLGNGVMACRAGDNSPAGTVKDGWKKVSVPTPFGANCHWERAN